MNVDYLVLALVALVIFGGGAYVNREIKKHRRDKETRHEKVHHAH